jgi:phosphotransferase system enzyme I (PtsP)
VAAYYQPYHPAVLRSLAHIVATAHKHGKPISVCGEVAHQKDFIPFLLGIGVKRLSVDPQFLPLIQNEIRKIPMERARAHARQLLSAATVSEMAAYEY